MYNVDILLATYSGERFLKEQIDSILSQSYQDFRLTIRDDDSKDRTLEIIRDYIKKYPDKISLMEDRSHQGVIGSFSRLLDISQAPYVMFADQDDVWLKDKVLLTLEKMKQMESIYEGPILVHGDLIVVDENLKVISPSFWKYINIKPLEGSHLNRILVQNEVTGCTIMMNKALSDLARPIPLDCVMHDWWIALVVTALGQIGIVKGPLIYYRQHGKNTLGAKEYRVLDQVIKALRGKNIKTNKMTQASLLSMRYQSNIASKYVSMRQSSFIRNKYLTLRYRFFTHGILRNLYCFFFKKLP